MRFNVTLLAFALMTATVLTAAPPRPIPSGPLVEARQILVVVTPGFDSVDGRLQRYERSKANASWKPVGGSIAIVVGKRGLAWGRGLASAPTNGQPIKQEGDGRSPAGIFRLGKAFGYAPVALAGSRLTYVTLTPSMECVDDTRSQHYNRIVDRSQLSADWNSSEHMRDTGESYRWGIVVDHNGIAESSSSPKIVAGAGSCIFLHIWKGPGHGTAGCTAMAADDIETLLRWLDPADNPALVQLTAEDYARLMPIWHLPLEVNLPAR